MRLSMTSKVAIAALVWSLSTAVGWPQQTDQQPAGQPSEPAPTPPQQPEAPGPPPGNTAPLSPPSLPASQEESTGTPAEAPGPVDTRSLAGAEAITPTLPGGGRSYILPSFSVWQAVDTNGQIAPGGSTTEAVTIPTASLMLNHVGRRHLLTLDYGGGVMIYDTNSDLTSWFQQLSLFDKYTAARWNLLIGDRVSYLPQASYGFGGIGSASGFSGQSLGLGGGIGLNAGYTPGQSILTGRSGTTTNTAVAQAQYHFTPRSSFTAVGAFGIVDYIQAGLSSGNQTLLTAAYDHQLTSFDTITVAYSFGAFRFNGGSDAINNHLLRLGYGHRVTDRLTFAVLGGPQYTESTITGVSGVQRHWGGVAEATLGYKVERGSLDAHYLHYVSLGSGVFNGAVTDTVNGNFSRELSRTWNMNLGLGYSHNKPLGAYSINPNFTNPGTFDYEFGHFRLGHNFGRNASGFFTYTLERQESGQAFVPGANGRVIIRHLFGIGLELHPRPWPI
jgi:hypothetical protein